MADRKLATIEQIIDIQPIPDADAIEVATVRGWKVVVKKGEFKVGDLVVYLEIDSIVPYELAPFLSKGREPSIYDGLRGERLRTVRLRGQVSQGLILPLSCNSNVSAADESNIGCDVTDHLGIKKYDPAVPACLAGLVKGAWPSAIPKTDQERIQNLKADLRDWQERDLTFEASEKLDGSSCTFYMDPDADFNVCSRNLNLKEDDNNSFWKIAKRYEIEKTMRDDSLLGYAIQGELIGEGIQGNKYAVKGQDFYVFDIFNANTGKYLSMDERNVMAFQLGLKHVPLVDKAFKVRGHTIESLLAFVEAKSALNGKQEQEGNVFKCIEDPSISFKVISNRFLIKGGD